MDFAKRELVKYGWEEGKGLGKQNTGITKPLRPKLKFDCKGLGYNYGEEYSFKWWEHVYDKAAANVSVERANDGAQTSIKTNIKKPTQISTKKIKKDRKSVEVKYSSFLKEAILEGNIEKHIGKSRNKSEIPHCDNNVNNRVSSSRTIKRKLKHSVGKLARLQTQEELYLMDNK